MEVNVDASEVEQVLPVRILKHQYYYDPTGNGGLFCVWVKLEYSDGSRTDGYVNPNSSVTARRALTFCELTPKEKMHRRY